MRCTGWLLVALLEDPALLPRLAPLISREMVLRLLAGPHGYQPGRLAVSGECDRPGAKDCAGRDIAQAVIWKRQHFAEEMRVEALAERANMSLTTLRRHFRTISGMSPMRLPKLLRLQEARQLMLGQNMSAGSASAIAGYESASQFHRGSAAVRSASAHGYPSIVEPLMPFVFRRPGWCRVLCCRSMRTDRHALRSTKLLRRLCPPRVPSPVR